MRQLLKTITVLLLTFLLFAPIMVTAAVTKYDLEANINIAESEVTGIARIAAAAGEKLLVKMDTLAISYVKLNGKTISYYEDFGALQIVPEESGTLEISYRARFSRGSESGVPGAVDNVISSEGVSLTRAWYPDVEGLHYFSLRATLPRGYEAVSEAEDVMKVKKGGVTEFRFNFPHALDSINLIASDKYVIKKDVFRGVEVSAYFFAEDAGLADSYIEFTKKYLQLYEGLLGKFPYRRFAVAENFLPTGYSFPTFTLLGKTVVRLPFIVETSLGHEILHQWFGNYVYVDYKEGNWAEGLTTYLADHLYEERKDRGWEYRKQVLTEYRSYVTAENDFPLTGFRGRFDFSSKAVGYGKAAMVFHMLRTAVGDEAFFSALKDVVQKGAFTEASWGDLKEAFERSAGQDLSWFFQQWTDRTGLPEISIYDLKVAPDGSDYRLTFTVCQKEKAYRLTLPLTVYMRSGPVKKLLPLDSDKNSFEFNFTERPERVVFDGDYDVARQLAPDEFAPVVARLSGEKNLLIALPPENAEMYGSIIEKFDGEGVTKKAAGDIKTSEVMSSSVMILGVDNPLTGRIFGRLPREDAGLLLLVKENPFNPGKVIGIISGKSKSEVEAASGKISHYGKYGKLLFENGRNIVKQTEQTGRGIIMDTYDDAPAVEISSIRKLSDIIDRVSDKKIIYVGESHTETSHHAVQLDVITGLFRKNNKIAIGMEMFQRPFQQPLDSFIAGDTDEAVFLKSSEYFKRWIFDYNLYKAILDFARREKIPVVALNLQRKIVEKVSREGLDALTDEERKAIPVEIDFSDKAYRERLEGVFKLHKDADKKIFDYFYQSQLLWDETMAMSVDEFMSKNPGYQMVVLAGNGHLEYGSGIPVRTFRRNGNSYAIILSETDVAEGIADYVVFPKTVEGITAPKLMVMISEEKEGLKITGLPEDSVSEKAGIKKDDIILSIDGKEMKGLDDVKIYLFYKKTGDTVKVEVLRKEDEEEKKLIIDVTL
ncbi:MAG: ChaN family lipoprotein [Nitrospirae bacterium]|nr:ChaN family lipoprotein [Nitrospirota bacterium]